MKSPVTVHIRGPIQGYIYYPTVTGGGSTEGLGFRLDSNLQPQILNPTIVLGSARKEGMDPYSSPCIAHDSSFHFLFRSFIPKPLNLKTLVFSGPIVVSIFFSIPSFPANQEPEGAPRTQRFHAGHPLGGQTTTTSTAVELPWLQPFELESKLGLGFRV